MAVMNKDSKIERERDGEVVGWLKVVCYQLECKCNECSTVFNVCLTR